MAENRPLTIAEKRDLAFMEGEKHFPLRGEVKSFIFGFNDGLITTLSVIAGVSGAILSNWVILVAGLAGVIAEGIAMSFGAYIASKSQRDLYEKEIRMERMEIETEPEEERAELRVIYRGKGFTEEEVEMIVNRLTSNKEMWLKDLVEQELGLFPEKFDRPIKEAVIIGAASVLGGFIPLIPFVFNYNAFFLTSLLLSIGILFAVGAVKNRLAEKNPLMGGLEMTAVALGAAIVTYLAGFLISYALGNPQILPRAS